MIYARGASALCKGHVAGGSAKGRTDCCWSFADRSLPNGGVVCHLAGWYCGRIDEWPNDPRFAGGSYLPRRLQRHSESHFIEQLAVPFGTFPFLIGPSIGRSVNLVRFTTGS